jgi:hypothetical protein
MKNTVLWVVSLNFRRNMASPSSGLTSMTSKKRTEACGKLPWHLIDWDKQETPQNIRCPSPESNGAPPNYEFSVTAVPAYSAYLALSRITRYWRWKY